MRNTEIPLFPLNTLVFPGGLLPLRIFEQRYIDMVRECSRSDSGFGVCLIIPGDDDNAGHHARVGTLARIEDWYTLEGGLLGISVRGQSRFRVESTRAKDNGLLIGSVRWLPGDSKTELPLEFSVLGVLATRYVEQAGNEFFQAEPEQLNRADFVSYRLCELLPLPLLEKQQLLEMDDVMERLAHLQRVLPRFQRP